MTEIFKKLEKRYAIWKRTRIYRKQFRTLEDLEREQEALQYELDEYRKVCDSRAGEEAFSFYISQMVGIADRMYCLDTVHKELLLKKEKKHVKELLLQLLKMGP